MPFDGVAVLCILVIYCSLTTGALQRSKYPRKAQKLIIDTDAGGDDAGAILLILKSMPRTNDATGVLAITCSYGNTELDIVTKNVMKILTIANRTDIPVYKGAKKPLTRNYTSDHFFGTDGFGNFEFYGGIKAQVDDTIHASLAMIQMVRKYPGEVNILVIGPLTNVALSMQLDPTFAQNVRQFFIMGSSVAGVGNKSPNVEYNFGTDPESNFIVLSSLKKPCILYPWETGLRAGITKKWRKRVLGSKESATIRFLNQVERISLQWRDPFWSATDIMIAAVMLSPSLVTKSILVNVEAVYDGKAEGSVLVDYQHITDKPPNSVIIQSIDVTSFKNMLLRYLV